ncbi:hypothetical protein BYT27DRAFT_7196233, partial [Phlegmacium glaucopus]
MRFKYYILYSTSQDKMYCAQPNFITPFCNLESSPPVHISYPMSSPDFIEIHDEPDIKGSSRTVLEALKALAGRKNWQRTSLAGPRNGKIC